MVEKKHQNSRDKPDFHLSLRKTFAKHLLNTYYVLGNLFTSVNGDEGTNVKRSSILGSSHSRGHKRHRNGDKDKNSNGVRGPVGAGGG